MSSEVDAIAERGIAALTRFARLTSTIAGGFAVIGLFVSGLALLVGLAALTGGEQVVWAVVGGVLVIVAAGAPLLASLRLRAVPHHTRQLVADVRTLLQSGGEARQVIIDTTEATSAAPSGASTLTVTVPALRRLRTATSSATTPGGSLRRLGDVAQLLLSLPRLLAMAGAAIMISAFLGFVLLLVWIF